MRGWEGRGGVSHIVCDAALRRRGSRNRTAGAARCFLPSMRKISKGALCSDCARWCSLAAGGCCFSLHFGAYVHIVRCRGLHYVEHRHWGECPRPVRIA